jgi:hypothetical protein
MRPIPTSSRWRLAIFVVVFLAAVFWVFAFAYHRLAKSNFEAYAAELAAMGESLEVDALRPPPIDNHEDDVAAAPVFAGLLERCLADPEANGKDDPVWGELAPKAVIPGFPSAYVRRQVNQVRYVTYLPLSRGYEAPDEAVVAREFLDHGETHADSLDLIRDALARPRADFQVSYGDFSAPLPGLNSFQGIGELLYGHGQAALFVGQSDLARSDAIAMLRLSRHVGSQATLIHLLIGIAVHDLAISLIQEGLGKGNWSDADLRAFEGELKSGWIEEAFLSAVRMERAGAIVSPEPDPGETESFAEPLPTWIRILHCIPDLRKGWQYDNTEHHCRRLQVSVLEDDKGVRMTSRLATTLRDIPQMSPAGSDPRDRFRFLVETYRHGFAEAGFAAFTGMRMKALRSRVYRDHARIAVALALHRSRHGQYPASLEALSFTEEAHLPLDPFTGSGYLYRPLDEADYLLYSPGPDGHDDGGLIRFQHHKGDLGWRLHLPDDFDFEAYREA